MCTSCVRCHQQKGTSQNNEFSLYFQKANLLRIEAVIDWDDQGKAAESQL